MSDRNELCDKLTGALIGLARATEGNDHLLTDSTIQTVIEALSLLNNVTSDTSCEQDYNRMLARVDDEKRKLVPDCYHCLNSCGRTDNYDMHHLSNLPDDLRSLKIQILTKIQRIAYKISSDSSVQIPDWNTCHSFYKALYSIGADDWGTEELKSVLLELDMI